METNPNLKPKKLTSQFSDKPKFTRNWNLVPYWMLIKFNNYFSKKYNFSLFYNLQRVNIVVKTFIKINVLQESLENNFYLCTTNNFTFSCFPIKKHIKIKNLVSHHTHTILFHIWLIECFNILFKLLFKLRYKK